MADSVLPLSLVLEIDAPLLSGALEDCRLIELICQTTRNDFLLDPTPYPQKLAHDSTGGFTNERETTGTYRWLFSWIYARSCSSSMYLPPSALAAPKPCKIMSESSALEEGYDPVFQAFESVHFEGWRIRVSCRSPEGQGSRSVDPPALTKLRKFFRHK
ncbi:hypothetical protein B0H34DRAFT_860481, partial [Crassisporium funariophilum]